MTRKEILTIARILLSVLESESEEFTVLFTDDKEIRSLNNEFRNKDKATDVLSFPLDDGVYIGDIAISVQTARRQATQYGVKLRQEILRLLIHGILHLKGYEHEGVSKTESQRMRRKEKQLYGVISNKWPKRF